MVFIEEDRILNEQPYCDKQFSMLDLTVQTGSSKYSKLIINLNFGRDVTKVKYSHLSKANNNFTIRRIMNANREYQIPILILRQVETTSATVTN